ncbi:AAA ATPase, partial [Coemansia reversa NRRL 1564]
LKESIVWPLQYREQFKRLGIRAPRGVLLHGPPGTGKTMLAKAAATEVAANFIPVAIPDLIKGEVGESEKALAAVFETAKRSPSILFLDEIEAIFGSREHAGETGKKLISQLFLEMDNIPENAHMVVLAATNEYRLIDPSILRPGRLDKIMHIPRPSEQSRLDILQRLTRHLTLEDKEKLLVWLAAEAELSGAEIKSLVRSACYSAIQRKS